MHSTNINLIYGKEPIFNLAADLLNQTQQEMAVISIGEEITPILLLAVRRARERGVIIRMVAHRHNFQNHAILKNLARNGYDIRHYPDWGFHLAVYDSSQSLLIINNPQKTDERVAVHIVSIGLSQALRDYFTSVWTKATPI